VHGRLGREEAKPSKLNPSQEIVTIRRTALLLNAENPRHGTGRKTDTKELNERIDTRRNDKHVHREKSRY
jgi:hypothetical protein